MVQAKQLKIKKKRWISIIAPSFLNHMVLGETYVGEPQEAVGRTVELSLTAITGDPKRQSTHVSFFIDGVKEGSLTTSIKGAALLPTSVKRLVRRSKERVDDSFEAVTRDGKKLRIKPIAVTRLSTSRQVCSQIQHKAKDAVIRCLARSTLEQFWQDFVAYKVQKEIAQSLSKIYPIQIFEIRSFAVIGTGTPPELPAVESPQTGESEEARLEDQQPAKRRSRQRKPKAATMADEQVVEGVVSQDMPAAPSDGPVDVSS